MEGSTTVAAVAAAVERRALERESFRRAQTTLKKVLRAIATSGGEMEDVAERMAEEIAAWTPRYFSDEMRTARRLARQTGTVLPEPEDES